MQRCASAGQTSHAAAEPRGEPAGPPVCFLSAHAYCCEFSDGAIILDLRGDTYLGIDAQHLPNLQARIGNWPDSGRSDREVERHGISASDSLIADLLARKILTTSPTSRQPSPATNPTMALTVASSGSARRRIPLTHIAQFSFALLVVALRLRRNGLAALLDWFRKCQSSIRPGNSVSQENVAERLASFLRLRTWCYTARRRCLFDSLVLSVYLTRGMVRCTFVIGVVTKPFLAHAWVQIGESVLNDTAEHVHDFKPILSIGGE
jgi:Transglutaminase-like superfamily